jgi:hypothetical protein
MEYTPPPLFKQGASARAKMLFFALIAVGLLMADSRLKALSAVRQVVGAALYPLQVVAMLPRDAIFAVSDYFTSLTTLKADNEQMRVQQVLNAQQLQQSQELLAENAHLRKLHAASERLTSTTRRRRNAISVWKHIPAYSEAYVILEPYYERFSFNLSLSGNVSLSQQHSGASVCYAAPPERQFRCSGHKKTLRYGS